MDQHVLPYGIPCHLVIAHNGVPKMYGVRSTRIRIYCAKTSLETAILQETPVQYPGLPLASLIAVKSTWRLSFLVRAQMSMTR